MNKTLPKFEKYLIMTYDGVSSGRFSVATDENEALIRFQNYPLDPRKARILAGIKNPDTPEQIIIGLAIRGNLLEQDKFPHQDLISPEKVVK